jgi:hypothetical protein
MLEKKGTHKVGKCQVNSLSWHFVVHVTLSCLCACTSTTSIIMVFIYSLANYGIYDAYDLFISNSSIFVSLVFLFDVR